MTADPPKYQRILLKLSGEALAGERGVGFDFDRVAEFCDEIKGVIEIGFLHPVHERDVQFMETVAASVGAAMANVLHRQRLQAALEEQQALNEELQVQQEELRTANEELEEQSRALEESQSALENQQAELEQTNEQLAEQAANLDNKNSALVQAQEQLRERRSEERRVGKECRSRWSPYH